MTDLLTSIVVATMDTRHFHFMAVGTDREHAEAALTAAWAKHCDEYNVPMDPEDEDTPFAEWYGVNYTTMEIGDGVRDGGDLLARGWACMNDHTDLNRDSGCGSCQDYLGHAGMDEPEIPTIEHERAKPKRPLIIHEVGIVREEGVWRWRVNPSDVWSPPVESWSEAQRGYHDALTPPITFKVGDRVRLTQDVERFPHFIAKAGSTGVVSENNGENQVSVKMDEILEGAEEWDNEVCWYDDDHGDHHEALIHLSQESA